MTEAPQGCASCVEIIRLFLDTRALWPIPPESSEREEVSTLTRVASRALNLLSVTEQASVLKFYHLKDAKMSLASHLLKRLVIAKYLHIPWSEITISRDPHGKPCFLHPTQGKTRVSFNVSHQAGIVTIIAAISIEHEIRVGTDIVCVSERRGLDYKYIEREGFFDWVDMHRDVLSESELSHLKLSPVDLGEAGIDMEGAEMTDVAKQVLGRCQKRHEQMIIPILVAGKSIATTVMSNVVIDSKIRRFYATWCLREAFVKMTGEALLAPWLKRLEIVEVKAPRAKKGTAELEEGEIIDRVEIVMKDVGSDVDRRIKNVRVELMALETDFMVAQAIEFPKGLQEFDFRMYHWKKLDLNEDIVKYAESIC